VTVGCATGDARGREDELVGAVGQGDVPARARAPLAVPRRRFPQSAVKAAVKLPAIGLPFTEPEPLIDNVARSAGPRPFSLSAGAFAASAPTASPKTATITAANIVFLIWASKTSFTGSGHRLRRFETARKQREKDNT
jgi:hypothetical protein